MQKGTVKFFNEAKGFGFIKAEDGQELFNNGLKQYKFHKDALQKLIPTQPSNK